MGRNYWSLGQLRQFDAPSAQTVGLECFGFVICLAPKHENFCYHVLQDMYTACSESNSVELSRYNEYIDIIKNQIQCANEATQILQKTYTELQSVDQNFQQHVRRNPSQQRSQSQSPAQN